MYVGMCVNCRQMFLCMYVRTYVCMYVCVYVGVYVCVYVGGYVCRSVCRCAGMYV